MISIIKRPVISEKSIGQSKNNFYTFLVDKRARKPQIAVAIEELFGVDVLSVKTMAVKPVSKMQRTRKGYFEIAGAKKTIVTIKAGQKIDLFDLEARQAKDEEVTVTTAEGEPVNVEVKEKKSRLKGTKVKIERTK